LPDNPPWDPIPARRGAASAVTVAAQPALQPVAHLGRPIGQRAEPTPATREARALQASASRRIWSTLLDYRDWVSYIYVPLVVPILVLLPYFVARSYERSHLANQLVQSLTQGNYELELLTHLLEAGPDQPWTGAAPEDARTFGYLDLTGYEVLQSSSVIDLRTWSPDGTAKAGPERLVRVYERLKVHKQTDTAARNFRIPLPAISTATEARFPKQHLEGKLRRSQVPGLDPEDSETRWEVSFDFQSEPVGSYIDLFFEWQSPGLFLSDSENSGEIACDIPVTTSELTMWILMPAGRKYQGFDVSKHPRGRPEKVEEVKVVTEYLAEDYSIIAFKLQSVKAGYTYKISWFYQ
jgi:hypothetical protein